MKILAIRGKNLASLEGDFEIDFTEEPLKSAGIFAITGSTGAGKSTLLDALCLALFDQTPRTNAGENVFIQDVKDKTINQKDSRTILRRGTGEGYAEVDFLSLSGEKYRATWMVKRARTKFDGSMQNSELRLINLSSGSEIAGRKSELLPEITKLIGLNFDQFTRAVLLAQGDFATFLKAKTQEKAELLEKLTGTDIYSRISVSIYEKTKRAEQDLNVVKERIADIDLLSQEEAEQLTIEKRNLEEEIQNLTNISLIVNTKIKWIQDEEILRASIQDAQEKLNQTQEAISQAEPRYAIISQIEEAQEIRDTFNDFQNTRKQISINQTQFIEQKTANAQNETRLTEAHAAYTLCEKASNEFNEKYKSIEPKIQEARTVDIRIIDAKKNNEEAFKEFDVANTLHHKIDRLIQNREKEVAAIQKQIQILSQWFEENKKYTEIIPRVNLIINLLDDSKISQEQIKNNSEIYKKNQKIFEEETQEVTILQEELTRLNTLLPSEIANLRVKLREGNPCPVCGSIHHSTPTPSEYSRLQDEELTQAKKNAEIRINNLGENLEKRKTELMRLSTLIETYQNQESDIRNKVQMYLSNIELQSKYSLNEIDVSNTFILPDDEDTSPWQDALQNTLEEIAEKWTENTDKLTQLQQTERDLQTTLTIERNNKKEAEQTYVLKREKYIRIQSDLEKLQSERSLIFQGKSVDEVVSLYTERATQFATELKKSSDDQNAIIAKQEAVKGAMAQLQNELTRLNTIENRLQTILYTWLANTSFTLEDLASLLTKDIPWVNAEKQALHKLKESETIAIATLAERNKNMYMHRNAEIKPDLQSESRITLRENFDNIRLQIEEKNKRHTQIEFLFANHQKGKEKIKSFEKELVSMSDISENWKKLNELFGSATGAKFKEIAQGYTLDILLSYANKHLQQLSKRYELQRIPNTLALQVVDLDMLGEIRTVHSLSGGESFLISLALALGLSSLSSNRMKVESLFIDEGFGSLDIETLRIAMDALESLQTQGRKIGVISHVAEMTERISTQIRVIKTVNGRSRIEVVG